MKFRGRMGPGDADDKSIRLLNRIITWDEEGIHWEGDQRHAEILVRELGLLGDSRGATTPADKKTGQDIGSIKQMDRTNLGKASSDNIHWIHALPVSTGAW